MTNPNPTTKYSVRSIVYDVPSATECGRKYLVNADPETGRLACECKGAAYGRDCWHQKAIRSGLVKPRIRIAQRPAPRLTFDLDDLWGDGGVAASAAVASWRQAS